MFSAQLSQIRTTSDNEGAFELQVQEDGLYDLELRPPNHAPMIVYGMKVAEPNPVIRLTEGGAIEGYLTEQLLPFVRKPIAGVTVKASCVDRSSFSYINPLTAVTDAKGFFRFEHVRPILKDHGGKWLPREWIIEYGGAKQKGIVEEGKVVENVVLTVK